MSTLQRLLKSAVLVAMAAALALTIGASQHATASPANAPVVTGWTTVKFVQTQPACTGAGFQGAVHYQRLECGFGYVAVAGTKVTNPMRSSVEVSFLDADGNTLETQVTTARTTAGSEGWQFNIVPQRLPNPWPAGPITIRVTKVDADGVGPLPAETGNFGETGIILNALGATVAAGPGNHTPGDAIPVNGTVYEIEHVSALTTTREIAVAATVSLQVRTPAGEVRGPYGPFTAGLDGRFSATLPAGATAGITADASTGFKTTPSIEVVDAFYDDPASGRWASERAGAGALPLFVSADTLELENSFVSDVGWVKPGETYPFRVFVKNHTSSPATGATVTIAAPAGATFTKATPTSGATTATVSGATITWQVGSVPAAAADGTPAIRTLVVEARADTTGVDPQIVWKDLSSTATLSYTGGPTLTSKSHGPKVIPPKARFDTARYGDRPFAVVPADYFDRKHGDTHTGEALREKINSADVPGSTFNLFQEMSYGQLFPNGTVPSSGITSASWDVEWKSDRYRNGGFQFTSVQPGGACYGATFKELRDTPVYTERISGGWYQLPGDTAYYGGDVDSFANIGVPQSAFIDGACGPVGKAVYDAAHIADPEIDYSDYDTDKDGVVDFFMLVFVGEGGHGGSQTSVPPYDNIWPHSSSLEHYYTDKPTGLKGYISDDQLKDLQGRPLYYTDASRSEMATTPTAYPVYVRVGPYNVNPESAIDKASVISHEYGHSLGLPDYYSSGTGRTTYGDWNLMATDKSQHMDVNAKQELGWVVPRVLKPGQTTVSGWRDSKVNTHRIDWVQPDGTPYTLTGAGVNNGEAYVAKLPAKRIIDPAKVPSGSHVWWSGSGNDFGCTPAAGHNLDIQVPQLATLPAGTPVKLTFKSYWDIEWDYDYGFVLAAVPGESGVTYRSLPSAKGYSTPQAVNPNANSCQLQYGNGLTGASGSYAAGTDAVDRLPEVGGYPEGGFVEDEYDLTPYAGTSTTAIRLSYATDPGLARPGWFIDDLKITTGDGTVLYSSDFEGGEDEPAIYNGGCQGDLSTSDRCTAGWQYVNADDLAEADHAYYLELRDRSGFDADGKGENDRAPIAFSPGLLLTYTNEIAGYGNTGQSTGDAPNQSPLDSQPQPGVTTPNLNDAAFTAAVGKNAFSDAITATQPGGWVDNYKDAKTTYADGNWHFDFGCLDFAVTRMTGTGIGLPTDLEGDASFSLGAGCAAYDYGYGVPNAGPTAVAQAKPATVQAGEPVALDGSASFDDVQPASELGYAWDVDGDGAFDDSTEQQLVHTYATPGTYAVGLKVTDAGGLSDADTVIVTVTGGVDLTVTGMSAGGTKGVREGEKVAVSATVTNAGSTAAPASTTEFLLDGSQVLGLVATPALAPGASATVSVLWDTRNTKGTHEVRATADQPGAVTETDETNNAGSLTVSIKGNKVQNGSFEQASSSGSGPEGWSGSSSSSGTTSWSDSGTGGSKGASATGSGGTAATSSPTWTSAPVAVVPGETLDFTVAVSSASTSSPATAGLVFLGTLGTVLDTVTVLTAPVGTTGFETLESAVTVPLGAAQARIVLRGFSPTDLATRGTVTFDDVGLFAR
jgi:M6 family metalloprotease-like protein